MFFKYQLQKLHGRVSEQDGVIVLFIALVLLGRTISKGHMCFRSCIA